MAQPNTSIEVPAGIEVLVLEVGPEATGSNVVGDYFKTSMTIWIPMSSTQMEVHSIKFWYAGYRVQARLTDINFK